MGHLAHGTEPPIVLHQLSHTANRPTDSGLVLSYLSRMVWCLHRTGRAPLDVLGSQVQEKWGDLGARESRDGRGAHKLLAAAALHTPPQAGIAHLVPSHLQGTHQDQTGPAAIGPRRGDEVDGSRLPSPGNTWHHGGRAPLPRSHSTSHMFGNPGRPGGREAPHVLAMSAPHETALIGKHPSIVQMPQCWTAGWGVLCLTDRLTHRPTQVGRKAPPSGAVGP